jgi:DNA repair exonuclease SbcCD ATPase subunit
VDLLESTKQGNKEYIHQLKSDNRELRKQLADLKRTSGGGTNATGAGGTSITADAGGSVGGMALAGDSEEVAMAIAQLNKARKAHDDLRHRVQSQSALLEELKDEVKDLELEAKKPSLEDTPETRKIRMLENRLDKAMIKYNEAQSIRKTYEQIVKRLKEERIGFDNQLAAIERALSAKQHDYEELQLLSADATHAREMLAQELERARGQYEDEKRAREKELREKQQYVKIRLEMMANPRAGGKHRASTFGDGNSANGDLNTDEEKQLRATLAMTAMQHGAVSEEKKEHRSKIDIFESAFRKIKEATGVSDVNEVIQKLTSQESTTDNLMSLSKENQARLEHLQAEHAALKARVEELKYSGSGGGHRRKLVDDHEQNLALATAKLERAKLKYERLAKVLIAVKAGVEHLVDKMESVRDDDQVMVVTDETIVAALQDSEAILARLLGQIKAANASTPTSMGIGSKPKAGNPVMMTRMGTVKRSLATPSVPTTASTSATGVDVSDSEMLLSRPYNQRIPLPGANGLTAGEMEHDEMRHGPGANLNSLLDDPEEALSRDRVKRASSQVIMAQDKKMKKKMTASARGQLKKSRLPDLGNDSSDDDNNNNSGSMAVGGTDGSSPGRTLSGRGGPRSVSPKRK